MSKQRVEQSNPFSTGGGGTNFEIGVQSYFTICMLLGWKVPGLKDDRIQKIKLQGRHDEYNTDDCIIFGENGNKLLCQIKHSITITESNEVFKEVIKGAWNDFQNPELFRKDTDTIALIVAGLSATDIDNTRFIFRWANACEDEEEFHKKMYLKGFSSKDKQNKYESIKTHLQTANGGEISDKQVWEFLKHFFILPLELDVPNSALNCMLNEAINHYFEQEKFGGEVYRYVADINQNAGVITCAAVEEALNVKVDKSKAIYEGYEKLKHHTELILSSMRNKIANVSIKRDEELERVNQELEKNNVLLISGERGAGKSGIVKSMLEHVDLTTFGFVLRAEELNEPHRKRLTTGCLIFYPDL